MSKRYLKYETEHENPLVDENGVLKTESPSGGYKYFGISVSGPDSNALYKMDTFGILNDPTGAKNGSNVTKSEFEEAYGSQPILLVPVDIDNGKALVINTEGVLDYDVTRSYIPKPVVAYETYMNIPAVYYANNFDNGGIAKTTLTFATE